MTRPTHFSIIGTTEVGRRVLPRTTVSRERACTTPASAAWWGMMPYRLFARFQPKGRPARLRRMPESFHPEKTRSALHANSSASNPYWCGSELTIAVSTAAYHSEPLTSRFTSSTSWPSSTVVMTTLRIIALACHRCNLHKGTNLSSIDPDSGDVVSLFRPRDEVWG